MSDLANYNYGKLLEPHSEPQEDAKVQPTEAKAQLREDISQFSAGQVQFNGVNKIKFDKDCAQLEEAFKNLNVGTEKSEERSKERSEKESEESSEKKLEEQIKETATFRKFLIDQEDLTHPTSKAFKSVEKNIIKGPFRDKQHYICVQHDLILEDYKANLRKTVQSVITLVRNAQNGALSHEAIQSFMETAQKENEVYYSQTSSRRPSTRTPISYVANGNSRFPLENGQQENPEDGLEPQFPFKEGVHVHYGATFICETIINEMICYRVKLGRGKSFEGSKGPHFWKGNAIHFSCNLQHFFLGKVVSLEGDGHSPELIVGFFAKPDIKFDIKYFMFAPEAYYEIYHGIVEVFRKIEVLPMEKYLVYCDMKPRPPAYLNGNKFYSVGNRFIRVLEPWPNKLLPDLNPSQQNAVERALTQEFAMIHGPPGTGKTYVAAKILENLMNNHNVHQAVPILVLSQTNNALDNLLERVLARFNNHDANLILRVGSRSSSELLGPYNLSQERFRSGRWPSWKLMQSGKIEHRLKANLLMAIDAFDGIISFYTFTDNIPERCQDQFWYFYQHLVKSASSIVEWLMEAATTDCDLPDSELKEAVDKVVIQNDYCYQFEGDMYMYKPFLTLKQLKENCEFLESNMLEQPEQIAIRDEYYKTARRFLYLHKKMEEGKALKTDEFEEFHPPSDPKGWSPSLHPDERWKLYFFWLKLVKDLIQNDIERGCLEFQLRYLSHLKTREDIDLSIFQRKLLIGMTTSGAIIHKRTLERLKPAIVVVEEASQVLESHIVATLTPHCQHLIMIGDHKQLRPRSSHQSVGKYCRLQISLFERMINNNIQVNTLNLQHRMHPLIAELVRPAYPQLQNHFSTVGRTNTYGIDRPVYFLHHTNREESGCENTKSKKNMYEAHVVARLANYFILKNNPPESITILTTYTLQVIEIRKIIQILVNGGADKNLLNVNVTTVDAFQGQENNIILLSLVRNNPQGDIGFLAEDNRVTVALSRAKTGLYILGNIDILSYKSSFWTQVRQTLMHQRAIVETLPLQHLNCKNHSQPGVTWVKEVWEIDEAHQCKCKIHITLQCARCRKLCQVLRHNQQLQHGLYFCDNCRQNWLPYTCYPTANTS